MHTYRILPLENQYENNSLDTNNILIKMNLKKRKPLKNRMKNSLQNSVFTFLKFHFIQKLLISKLLVSYGILCDRVINLPFSDTRKSR